MDEKRGIRLSIRQVLMVTLLGYCGYTTLHADFPIEAFAKWEWVWKALIFAIFLQIGRAHAELQSLMRISYAVFCLKKKNTDHQRPLAPSIHHKHNSRRTHPTRTHSH